MISTYTYHSVVHCSELLIKLRHDARSFQPRPMTELAQYHLVSISHALLKKNLSSDSSKM